MGSREHKVAERANTSELSEKSQQLLQGPLRHARTAALAMALMPLAAVAASTVVTNESCPSAGICGVVYYDENNNGIQDPTESGEPNVVVTISGATIPEGPCDEMGTCTSTNSEGVYYFSVPPGDYKIEVQIPNEMQSSPSNTGSDDNVDSDGVPDGLGNSSTNTTLTGGYDSSNDFGFWKPPVSQPGTGTPGYWKNHPEAWPVETILVGGVSYTKDQAIERLESVGKDRRLTMFSSLVPAMLNVMIGNGASCIASTIAAADAWMSEHIADPEIVRASSLAWKIGEPMHRQLDNYNNGMLCAPHRD
jgi:hypothetical protein